MEITANPIVWVQTVHLGYPAHFIYVLGIAKISGVIVLLIPNKLNGLKEWVFAGMFFDVIFAFTSNYSVDGISKCMDCIIAFSMIFTTYIMFRKINPVLGSPLLREGRAASRKRESGSQALNVQAEW